MSARDRKLLALLPALCVLLWVLFHFWLPHRERVRALESQIAQATTLQFGGSLPSVDVSELERLRAAFAESVVPIAPRVTALRWSGLADSLQRHGLRLVSERAQDQGVRALELEGDYLATLEWVRSLIEDPLTPAPRRVELLAERTGSGVARWNVWLP